MKNVANYYRRCAEESQEMAQKAVSAPDKERWLKRSEDWLKLLQSEEKNDR